MILLPRSSWSREYGDGASVDTALSDGSGSAGDGMSDSTSTSEPPPDVDDMHASLNATDASKVAELVETTIAAIPQIYQSPDHDASSPATPLTPRYLSDYATESDDDFLVVVRRPNSPRLFSWPCPFALSDPHAHALCLRHEHATARAVLWHMFRHHLRAPCCYRCGATFDYFVERNSHLAARTCEVKTLPVLEGIGEGMVYELQDLVGSWDRRHELDESFELLADERKYAQIWRVIFPAEEFHEVSCWSKGGSSRQGGTGGERVLAEEREGDSGEGFWRWEGTVRIRRVVCGRFGSNRQTDALGCGEEWERGFLALPVVVMQENINYLIRDLIYYDTLQSHAPNRIASPCDAAPLILPDD